MRKIPLASTVASHRQLILVFKDECEHIVRKTDAIDGLSYETSLGPEAEHLWESERRSVDQPREAEWLEPQVARLARQNFSLECEY